MIKIDLAKICKANGYCCPMDMDCKECKGITCYNCLQADVKSWYDEIISCDFEEWKAINSNKIQDI